MSLWRQQIPSQSAQILPATASAVAASTPLNQNLRTEAVVITGEQLGNGVASPQPTRQRMSIPPQPPIKCQTCLPIRRRTNQMPEAPTDAANSNTSNPRFKWARRRAVIQQQNAPNSSQGVVSYEDFVKALWTTNIYR